MCQVCLDEDEHLKATNVDATITLLQYYAVWWENNRQRDAAIDIKTVNGLKHDAIIKTRFPIHLTCRHFI